MIFIFLLINLNEPGGRVVKWGVYRNVSNLFAYQYLVETTAEKMGFVIWVIGAVTTYCHPWEQSGRDKRAALRRLEIKRHKSPMFSLLIAGRNLPELMVKVNKSLRLKNLSLLITLNQFSLFKIYISQDM